MNQVTFIRKEIFKMNQHELASVIGTTQATISRWEKGICVPDINSISKIRDEIISRGIEWNDSWFFEIPNTSIENSSSAPASEVVL